MESTFIILFFIPFLFAYLKNTVYFNKKYNHRVISYKKEIKNINKVKVLNDVLFLVLFYIIATYDNDYVMTMVFAAIAINSFGYLSGKNKYRVNYLVLFVSYSFLLIPLGLYLFFDNLFWLMFGCLIVLFLVKYIVMFTYGIVDLIKERLFYKKR